MDVEYYVGKKKLTWKKCTLYEYTNSFTPNGWEDLFDSAREDDVFADASQKLQAFATKHVIYPPMHLTFNIFESLAPEQIKVVISAQDPYHGLGQAMGWAFSVPDGVTVPPSLRNIYKELADEGYSQYKNRKTGNLADWVEKGVFLLNMSLTVNASDPGSHSKKGHEVWKDFTDMVISILNQQKHIAWILLGKDAQQVIPHLNKDRHGIFKAAHPSPANRSGGFLGSEVFQDAEEYLNKHGRKFHW